MNEQMLMILAGMKPSTGLAEPDISQESPAVATLYDYSEMTPPETSSEGRYPFSVATGVGLPDNLYQAVKKPHSDYWSIFQELKQSSL